MGTKSSFITKFKTGIRFVVSIFASREMGFIYCLIGTLSQIAHTYFLVSNISSLDGWWRIAQALGISVFVSSSLLFFTAIATNEESKDSKRIHLAVNLFMIIEICINFYYYSRHLIIDAENIQIYDFVFGVLVSCLIPVTIKLYAGLIRAKDWLEEFTPDGEIPSVDEESIKKRISEIIDKRLENFTPDASLSEDKVREIATEQFQILRENLEQDVADIYRRNSKIFLQQFENKLRYMIQRGTVNDSQPVQENTAE